MNNFTGNHRYLDVHHDTLEPFMADKDADSDAQHWVFIPADAFTAAAATSEPSSTGTSTPAARSSGGLSTGPIAGIAVGVGALVISVMVGLFIVRYRKTNRGREIVLDQMRSASLPCDSMVPPTTAGKYNPNEQSFSPMKCQIIRNRAP
jgi:hypothetical protein